MLFICLLLVNIFFKFKVIDGHFTHKPPIGKYTRFISDYDMKNKKEKQYYIKNKEKRKKLSSAELVALKAKNEIKDNVSAKQYMQNSTIASKFDD